MGELSREVEGYVAAIRGGRGGKRQAQRLEKLLAVCGGLPGVACGLWGDHVVIQVKKKTFAYYLNNHHGDGKVALCAKSMMVRQRELVEEDAERYYSPAYLGVSGWVGARLDLAKVDWEIIEELVRGGWVLQAPKKLVAGMDERE